VTRWLDSNARSLLTAGFLFIFFGVVISYYSPVTGYEVSIYSGSPMIFFGLTIISIIISILLVLNSRRKLGRMLGLGLGGLSMMTIISLPLIRGYHYRGGADSLTHLGRTKEINMGITSVIDFQYPALHTLSSIYSDIAGIGLTHGLMMSVSIFALTFFIGIPLSVRVLTGNKNIVLIAAYSSFLLLPVNMFSTNLAIHPSSLAILFTPFLLYSFINLYHQLNRKNMIIFVLLSTTYVILHPQHAANMIIFLSFFSASLIVSLFRLDYNEVLLTKVISPVMILFIVFWQWGSNLPAFEGAFSSFIISLLTVGEEETEAAADLVSQGSSLVQLGGSYEEMFLRIFLVGFIYSVLSSIFIYKAISSELWPGYSRRIFDYVSVRDEVFMKSFVYGFFAIIGIFIAYLLTGIDYYFRHYGFMMVFVTIMGAIGGGSVIQYIQSEYEVRYANLVVSLFVILVLLSSIPVLFPSPYVYLTSDLTTEGQMSGYETTFNYEKSSIPYDHVRSDASRFGQAIEGPSTINRHEYFREGELRGGTPDHFVDQGLRQYYNVRVYLTITKQDRVRDADIYNGFRFSHDDFDYLENTSGINRIHSNGEFELYLVLPEDNN